MSNTQKIQQTYTKKEVTRLIRSALKEWDDFLRLNIERLEKDQEFQQEAAERNFTPANYLYYAGDDTSIYHAEMVEIAFELCHGEELNKQAEALYNKFNNTEPRPTPSAEELLLLLRHHNRGDK